MLFRCTNQPFTRASSRVFRRNRWSKISQVQNLMASHQPLEDGGSRLLPLHRTAVAEVRAGGGWPAWRKEEGRWAMKMSAKPTSGFFSGELVGGLFGRLSMFIWCVTDDEKTLKYHSQDIPRMAYFTVDTFTLWNRFI